MYSTCLFCNKPLGANEVLEEFPVGRRVAFDSAKGRLWVVCSSCERWNLSPLDDRWEVIEQCERLFSNERKRVSTENIGLAKLSEGLELVRIGNPLRPEFAAWRYGDQFGRRRKRNMLIAGAGIAAVGTAYVAGWMMSGATFMMVGNGGLIRRVVSGSPNKLITRVEGVRPGYQWGRPIEIKRKDLDKVLVVPDTSDTYHLEVKEGDETYHIRGAEARRTMSQLLPAINRYGGRAAEVQNAVALIENAGHDEKFISRAITSEHGMYLAKFGKQKRLALEMAVHEDAERRALEGELKDLELAWQEAEEIAAISDSLLTPNFIQSALEKLRGK